MTSVALIIPAAGSGERLNRSIPKPYIQIAGKPILEHTIRRFLPLEGLRQILVATSAEYLDAARSILEGIIPDDLEYKCVEGGSERQHSIYNALQQTGKVELVAVHDAVRPFVKANTIRDCIQTAAEVGGAVAGVPAKDTIKKVNDQKRVTETPDRKYLWQTQTPQIFRRHILMEAYTKAAEEQFLGTDDSSLVERLGYSVKMVKGSRNNIKITYPTDLKLAKLILEE